MFITRLELFIYYYLQTWCSLSNLVASIIPQTSSQITSRLLSSINSSLNQYTTPESLGDSAGSILKACGTVPLEDNNQQQVFLCVEKV